MEFTGRYHIPASPEVVWAGLNDPEVLKACIPGCEKMEKTGPQDFEAAATLKIGPVRATFRGKVTMDKQDPPHSLTLKGEGQGGVAGFARGEAEVTLNAEDDGTLLIYVAKANVGGRLAQIGQRLIDGAARQIADDFFSRFSSAISQAEVAIPATEPETIMEPQAGVSAPAPMQIENREGLAPEAWVIGLIAVIITLLILFGLVL